MTHHLLPPLFVALFVGLVCPGLLARAGWAHRAPRLTAAVWGGLLAVFTVAVEMALLGLLLPEDALHRMPGVLLGCLSGQEACDLPGPLELGARSPARLASAALGAAALAVPPLVLGRELHAARRERARHARGLRLIGRRDTRLRATVVDHEVPAVYCLPGRAARIVVTTGAIDALTGPQLDAALRHEQAHITGRHHVFVGAADAFGRLFRGLPLARRARAEVPLLLEMSADDQALRHCSRHALATALYSMATARPAPRAVFAAGGPSAAVRIERILNRRWTVRPVLQGMATVGATACAVLPLATLCCFLLS
ncbi:M56 family metallopeptidase [Streptomyces sp. NPDC055607]